MPKPAPISPRVAITQRFLECLRMVRIKQINGVKNTAQVAAIIGAHQQNISNMEKGTRHPTVEQIARLCEHFNFSTEWVLLGSGNMEKQEKTSSDNQLNRIEKMLETLLKLKK
jgi:DNA-binding XRE family transcriptional regulator